MGKIGIDNVKEYWNKYPLASREIHVVPGTEEFFKLHDRNRFEDNEKFAMHFYAFDEDLKQNKKSILDAGCGNGFFTRFYAKKGYDVTAVDITERAVQLTKKSLEIFNLKAKVIQGNLENLQFDDNSFDYVVSNGVVHHTPDPEKAVRELYRVLKPGGRLSLAVYYRNILLRYPYWYITCPLLMVFFGKMKEREGLVMAKTPEEFVRSYDGDGTPIAELYSKEEAKKLVGQFKIISMEPHYFPMRFLKFAKLMPNRVRNSIHRKLDSIFGALLYLMLKKPVGNDSSDTTSRQ